MDSEDIKKVIQRKLIEVATAQVVAIVKDLPGRLITKLKEKFTFTLTITEDTETYCAFEEWLLDHYEGTFRNVTIYNYAKDDTGSKRKGDDAPGRNRHTGIADPSDFGFGIGYSQNPGGTMIVKIDGSKIKVVKTKTAGEKDKDKEKKGTQSYTLSGRDKDKIKKLVESIYEQYNSDHDQVKVFVSDAYGSWNMVKRIKGKPLSAIILTEEIHDKLVDDLSDFAISKQWYDERHIPYKRGYLLHGPPGNGKTSLSIAIASEHKRNIYCLDINKLHDDQKLRYAFQSLPANALLLIEDIDAAFHKRDVTSKTVALSALGGEPRQKAIPTHHITFACLLNCLDGVYYKDGLVTIMTTNNIDVLDSALIRPGRMDMKVVIHNPTIIEVELYMSRFYNTKVKLSRYVQELSMAEVQGVCITHKKDKMLAIAEIEGDSISIVLRETPELQQMMAEYDHAVMMANGDADDDEDEDYD